MTLIFRSSILSIRKSLFNSHNFLIETYHPSTSSFLFLRSWFNYILAKRSGHFEFKTLRSPTVVRLVSAAVPQVKNYEKMIPSGYAGGPTIFLRHWLRERKSREISPTKIISLACPSMRFLKSIQRNVAFKLPTLKTALATFRVATSSNHAP